MATSSGIARTPYLGTIRTRICGCGQEPFEVGRSKTLPAALKRIEGYWNVYLAFFGDQVIWLMFEVVDLRTGRLMWRNGRQLSTEEDTLDGTQPQDHDHDHDGGRGGQPDRDPWQQRRG